MEQSCQENHQWKLKTGWKFEAEDDIYIISTYLSASIYYKGKKYNCTDDPTKKNLFGSIMQL